MGSTTQALSGVEKAVYTNIQNNILNDPKVDPKEKEAFEQLRAQIVKDVLAINNAVQGEIGNEIRAKILYSGKYDKYKKP